MKILRWIFTALLVALGGAPGLRAETNGFSAGLHAERAQVWVVHDPEATAAFQPRANHVQTMMTRGLTNLTGATTVAEAWRALVSTQDVVGIKVFSEPGPNSGTRPAVVAAVISGLLAAGVPPGRIIIWDKQATDLRLAKYFELGRRFGVRVEGSAQDGYDEEVFYDTPLLGNLLWGDFEFGKKGESVGRKSFVSKMVSQEITKIINVTPLLNHNTAGVSGNLYSLALGSVDNTARFSSYERLAVAVPEIYALPAVGDKVVLNIVDALICQYEGGERGLLHYSVMLNELRFSRDPVALDILSIQELDRQRQRAQAPSTQPNLELYRNASLLQLGIADIKRIEVRSF